MAISSMTGFARGQGHEGDYHWAWELRSINGRNLDIRARLPLGFEILEPAIRNAVQKALQRGSVTIGLQCRRSTGLQMPTVNREALAEVVRAAREIERETGLAPASIDGLMALKGVVEIQETEETQEAVEARNAALLTSLDETLAALKANREQEGRELQRILLRALSDMKAKAAEAAKTAAAQPEAIRGRFLAKLSDFLAEQPPVPEERLAQEVAIMIVKADVREELDRLDTHIRAAEELIGAGGAIGRRMDFLAQELNREANTLCSKSADTALTAIGLELKTLIDQLREQVQNVE
jgi:uncharacterized protein (TIGR00255 family)